MVRKQQNLFMVSLLCLVVITFPFPVQAASSSGSTWAWGQNNLMQLGDGTTSDKSTPMQVSDLADVVTIDGGYSHNLAVDSKGEVWAWGDNTYGQLGGGTISDSSTPVKVSGLTDIVAISAGGSNEGGFCLAVDSKGEVWAWGSNIYGQLGSNIPASSSTPVKVNDLTDVVAVSAGGYHSLAVDSKGEVWAWGKIGRGSCGERV